MKITLTLEIKKTQPTKKKSSTQPKQTQSNSNKTTVIVNQK